MPMSAIWRTERGVSPSPQVLSGNFFSYEAKLAAWPEDAPELRQHRVLHEAALPMPPFRPWIGMNQIDARQ